MTFFWSKRFCFLFKDIIKLYIFAFSKVKELLKKMPIFDQNWVNATFSTKLKWHFYGLKSFVFYMKQHQTIKLGILKRKRTFEANDNF